MPESTWHVKFDTRHLPPEIVRIKEKCEREGLNWELLLGEVQRKLKKEQANAKH